MSTKKEFTLAELEEQYKLAEERKNDIKKQIEQKKKEETELRKAKLALEKDQRLKEVDEAFEKYTKLLKAYIDDYGVYPLATNENAFDLFSSKFWNMII